MASLTHTHTCKAILYRTHSPRARDYTLTSLYNLYTALVMHGSEYIHFFRVLSAWARKLSSSSKRGVHGLIFWEIMVYYSPLSSSKRSKDSTAITNFGAKTCSALRGVGIARPLHGYFCNYRKPTLFSSLMPRKTFMGELELLCASIKEFS